MPRSVNSEQLTEKMNAVKSILGEHLRKMEGAVIQDIMAEQEDLDSISPLPESDEMPDATVLKRCPD